MAKKKVSNLLPEFLSFYQLAQVSPSLIFLHNEEGKILYLNPFALKKTGYSKSEILKKNLLELLEKEETPLCSEASDKTNVQTFYSFLRTKENRKIPLKVNSFSFRKEDKVYFLTIAYDLSREKKRERELERLSRFYRLLSRCNQELIKATSEKQLLNKICSLIVREGGYRMAWVGFAEKDEEKSVRPVAQFGFEKGYLESIALSWGKNERGQGPTGRAIRTGKPVTCRNILKDPRFSPWRKEALKRG